MDKEFQIHPKVQQWWLIHSNLRKSLRAITTMLPLIGIINVVVSLLAAVAVPIAGDVLVCRTPGCITTASRVLRWMDEKAEPCNDFYNFACGKFLNETTIPDGWSSVSTYSLAAEKLREELDILIKEESNKNDSGPFILVENFLEACVNTTSREDSKLEVQSMLRIIDQLGGWPVMEGDKWNKRNSDWSWEWAVAESRKLGYDIDYIFKFAVGVDWKNSTNRIIFIDQADLKVKPDILKTKWYGEKLSEIFNEMVETAVWFGVDRTRARKEFGESLDFQTKLAKISLLVEERKDYSALYNRYSLKQVQRMYPYIRWVEYINALLPSPLSVDENEVIVILVPSYFESLRQLLRNTPKRTIANYLMWRVINFSEPFIARIYEPKTYDERRKKCIDIISGNGGAPTSIGAVMSRIIGGLYVRKHFREDSKATVLEMADGIRNELERIFNDIDWMDNDTRKSALDKLKFMSFLIGYPDELMDDEKTDDYYKSLKIDENNYL